MAAADVPPGFSPPNWDAPLDLQAQIALVPPGKTVKGFVLAGMGKRLQQRGISVPGLENVVAFKNYPFAQQLTALFDAAKALNPGSLRRGLREAGRMAFPATLDTMAGRVVFGALGNNPSSIFKASAKAYEMVGTGHARAVHVGTNHAHIHLKDLYAFPESYHVGVVEGVVLTCGAVPNPAIKQNGPTDVEVFVAW